MVSLNCGEEQELINEIHLLDAYLASFDFELILSGSCTRRGKKSTTVSIRIIICDFDCIIQCWYCHNCQNRRKDLLGVCRIGDCFIWVDAFEINHCWSEIIPIFKSINDDTSSVQSTCCSFIDATLNNSFRSFSCLLANERSCICSIQREIYLRDGIISTHSKTAIYSPTSTPS
jgi:hypothetical protein